MIKLNLSSAEINLFSDIIINPNDEQSSQRSFEENFIQTFAMFSSCKVVNSEYHVIASTFFIMHNIGFCQLCHAYLLFCIMMLLLLYF